MRYWATVEVDERGQHTGEGKPIWGIGTSENAALVDAVRWRDECPEETMPRLLQAFPCTPKAYRLVREWGGCVAWVAVDGGHRIDIIDRRRA